MRIESEVWGTNLADEFFFGFFLLLEERWIEGGGKEGKR